jgi:F-type H+-transporting ATPase subunit b
MEDAQGYGAFYLDPKFWVAMSFVVFAFFAVRVGGKRVVDMLDARTARIQGELNEAARLRAEAEATLARAKAEREEAAREAAALLERARAEAVRVGENARREAEAAAARRERMAMDRIAAAEAGAVNEVRQAAALLAASAVTQVIREHHDAEADAALVGNAIANLPGAMRAA